MGIAEYYCCCVELTRNTISTEGWNRYSKIIINMEGQNMGVHGNFCRGKKICLGGSKCWYFDQMLLWHKMLVPYFDQMSDHIQFNSIYLAKVSNNDDSKAKKTGMAQFNLKNWPYDQIQGEYLLPYKKAPLCTPSRHPWTRTNIQKILSIFQPSVVWGSRIWSCIRGSVSVLRLYKKWNGIVWIFILYININHNVMYNVYCIMYIILEPWMITYNLFILLMLDTPYNSRWNLKINAHEYHL